MQKKRLSGGGSKPAKTKPKSSKTTTTTTNINKIYKLGLLLLSSKLGRDGAARVQLILASQSPRRAGEYTS